MRSFGHDVLVVHSGMAALTAAPVYQPNLALLDIGMPEMDGYELSRLLRQHPQLSNVCLVALTGYGRDVDLQHSQSAGFHEHLVKPVDFDTLQNLLAQVAAQAAH
jgi:CheY-like chemotaxis protein